METSAARGIDREFESPWLMRLYGATVLLSATLLFLIQPMFAKMILPKLGGTPAVWNTCLVFFQTTLLLGYLYVHLGTVRFNPRSQVVVHVLLMLATLLALPIAVSAVAPPSAGSPIGWLLGTLAVSVGLPFFTVAATAPLLQRWFSLSSERDPYVLYAASNLGSLVGLLGYPLAVERTLTLGEQSALWLAGFAVLTVLMTACGVVSIRQTGVADHTPASIGRAGNPSATDAAADSLSMRLRWLVLAFVPSSLLLGVTTHISTDVASVPLLWVVPLAIYLLTFSAAFASRPPISRTWTARLLPVLITATLGALIANQRNWWWLALHLAAFGTVAMMCHRELADRRPAAGNLTRYYLWISLGGALGGLFNALVAPLLFTQIVEFPLMLAVAAFLRPSPAWRKGALEPWPIVAGVPAIAFAVTMIASLLQPTAGVELGTIATVFWIPAALGLAFANRTQPFAAAAVILAAAYLLHPQQPGYRVIYATRTFFGVHRVLENVPATQHRLTHGTTLHGWQNLDQRDRCVPTSYYYSTGPIAQVFDAVGDRAKRVGVLGLGAGGLVCYSRPGASWTYFEIDPAVERIARDPAFFTFLKNAKGNVDVVVGDGRLTLSKTEPGTFDVLVMDAFSSDAVPMHLLTREFIASALERLKPGGILAFHVSNIFFDLQPVVAASMHSLGVSALAQSFHSPSPDGLDSEWLIAARDPADLDAFARDPRWAKPRVGQQSWTDDFSNIFDAIDWRR